LKQAAKDRKRFRSPPVVSHRSLIVACAPKPSCWEITMKSVVFASVLAGAAAFAPASQKASSSALKMGYENELGVIAPTQFFGTLEVRNHSFRPSDGPCSDPRCRFSI
jgi:hypothetical protein